MSESSHAVFLSYASQDAEAAQRICGALRAAGIEVWFDQSALRGGDAWDQAIRKQIKSCVLFIPVISKHTHERDEGYFRLEWKLAVDRCQLMAADKAFLLPVVVDDTREDDERVPDRFRDVHWTRLPGGETSLAFVERVGRLVSPEPPHAPANASPPASAAAGAAPTIHEPVRPLSRSRYALSVIVAVVVAGALAYFAIGTSWLAKHPASPPTPPTAPASVTLSGFSPPPHSVAVLPFLNLSGDKNQDYFSDGLSEELLDSLARINELQVAARTSSFYFKGKDADLATIAHKLNVASVLEGSVRRSGNKIRVTAQLNNAVTGFHLWSQSYDRNLGDVLKLQTEIANAVASALRITLLSDVTARIELGGSRNPAAFDAYLRGSKALNTSHDAQHYQIGLAAYTEAIGLDPNYALALAGRSIALTGYAEEFATGPAIREGIDRAQADAHKAIELAPELAEGHLALAQFFEASLGFAQANEEYERAAALAPGNAQVLRYYSRFVAYLGRFDASIAAARRVVVLDPLSSLSRFALAAVLITARRYEEAAAVSEEMISLDPDSPRGYALRGHSYYELGNFQGARTSFEVKPEYWGNQWFLAMTYDKLGRHADAETALAKLKSLQGDAAAYQYATIYAQWGNTAKALEWLETAMRLRDPGLEWVKTDTLLDPLRKEPRFQAIERELKFPN
ncbi:MAG TPA: TIR domain-containing protein [Steroidobacteraceae bacterium]|nr:TIR domain-containing protein [Steroidobacteraceae bacterium]